MKVRVEPTACDGYVKCVRIAPALFAMNNANIAIALVEGELNEEQLKLAKLAAAMCPSKAIHITE